MIFLLEPIKYLIMLGGQAPDQLGKLQRSATLRNSATFAFSNFAMLQNSAVLPLHNFAALAFGPKSGLQGLDLAPKQCVF